MGTFMNIMKKTLRSITIFGIICLGLISIVATGDDDDDKGKSKSSNTAPVALIDAPSDSMVFEVSNSVTFTGSATDTEDLTLTGSSLRWSSSIDGDIGSGSNFMINDLSKGTHEITLTAMDSQGLADSTSISITINPRDNTLPTATITSPDTGATYNYGNYVQFSGTGYDAEDLWLSGTSLVWSSNQDGQLGTGQTVGTYNLSGGTHVITLLATDSEGTSTSTSITVVIMNTAPIATINYPPDGSTFSEDESIPFDGSGTDTEDGNLTNYSLVWTASNYGIIGYGTNISIDYLPPGTDIVINLKAVDEGGLVDSDSITITIE